MRVVSESGLAALQKLRRESEDEDESLEILLSKEDHVYVWDGSSCSLLAFHLESPGPHQVFSLTDPPMFRVRSLDMSSGGRWISLSGPQGVSCVSLPPRLGPEGRLGGGAASLVLKSRPIAERFFLCQKNLRIQQVGWHPSSPSESLLLVLSSDNYLRIYSLDSQLGESTPVRAITLRPSPLFGDSHYSIKSSLGETAVGFSFAPPSGGETSDNEWPLFVLLQNGSLYCILFNILNDKKPHRTLGPISIKQEDAKGEDDFCRILCLHPMISSPPIIVLASNGGTLYHTLILHEDMDDEADDDALSQISEWSTSVLNAEDASFSLHVFESVELELGLSLQSEKPFDYPISLHPDPTTPGRYFCSHAAGVHCVEVPMIFQLVKMAMQAPDEGAPLSSNGDCAVEHLLCTRVGPQCPPSPILGLTVIYPQTRLLALLSNFNLQTLSLAPPRIPSPPSLLNKETDSPLKAKKALSNKEPFEERIKSLLNSKSSSHPLIKSAIGTDLSPKDCLEFLTRSTQVLREENLSRLRLVHSEIQQRSLLLLRQKERQREMLSKLEGDRKGLRDVASSIAERYEDLKDNGAALISRIEIVLQNIQKKLPISSDAELSMNKELQGLNKKMRELKSSLDQVKTKDRYQLKQIQKTQLVQEAASSSPSQRWKSQQNKRLNNQLDDMQMDNVTEILQQDSLQITDLIRSLNSSKKKLACF